jgi:hypothetical protein
MIAVASSDDGIEPDATIVSCPFSIIITPLSVKERAAAQMLLRDASTLERWADNRS